MSRRAIKLAVAGLSATLLTGLGIAHATTAAPKTAAPAKVAADKHGAVKLSANETRPLLSGEKRYPSIGVRWMPAAAATAPVVSAQQAVAKAKAISVRPDVTDKGTPATELGQFSDDVQGRINSDDTVTPAHQNVLAWIITYADAPVEWYGAMNVDRSKLPKATAPLVFAVDAMTGDVLRCFQPSTPLQTG